MSINESGSECKICGDYNCDYVCTECYNKETHELQAKLKELEAEIARLQSYLPLQQVWTNLKREAREQAFKEVIENSQLVDLTVSKEGEWSNTSKGSGKNYRLIGPDFCKVLEGHMAEEGKP